MNETDQTKHYQNKFKSILLSIYMKTMQKIFVYLHLFRCYLLKYANLFVYRESRKTQHCKIIMHKATREVESTHTH